MKENLIFFGADKRLSGIFTPTAEDTGLPVVIILSAGIVHRSGPARLHVKLARRVAGQGFPAFRFDMSGLGECPPAPPGLGHEAQSIADTRDAITAMQAELGARPVILAGLCSGADNAYRTALEDEAISGLILLDPYAYEHQAAKLAYLAKRAQDPQKLGRFLGNLSARLTRSAQAAPGSHETEEDPDNDRIAPPLETFGRDFERLSARGVESCLVYTHSVHHLINKADQFFSLFGDYRFDDRVSVRTMMETDHTFTRLASQEALFSHLEDWLRRFAEAGPPPLQ